MGDGVLIYFGYPAAHEDDAERAVRAGLALIDAVATLPVPEPLQVRIGIATGLVVVGDLVGSGEAQERGVVGETPNLAARLQATAQAGTLVIADKTRRQIGALFEVEDLGHEAGTELARQRGPQDEPAGLRRDHVLDSQPAAALGQASHRGIEPGGIAQQGGDVLEPDARGWEVRDVADQPAQMGGLRAHRGLLGDLAQVADQKQMLQVRGH